MTTGHAAYLRVYEPMAAFPAAERRRWEAYVAASAAPERDRGPVLEHRAALRALLSAPAVTDAAPPRRRPGLPSPTGEGEQAFVAVLDGVTLVCPWRTTLRSWEALGEFRRGLPDPVADAFVPRAVADAAEHHLQQWRIEHPKLRSHILTSSWQVPLRWFLLVESAERGRDPGSGAVIYKTAMSRARRRLARGLAVLRRAIEEGPVTAGVEELGRWLEEFHPRSLVELDYGGLAGLLGEDVLGEDDSPGDVAAALGALSRGDAAAAAAAYERVTSRWRAVAALEAAN